jgi:hypothetical protein
MSNTADCPKCRHKHTTEDFDLVCSGAEIACEGCGFRFIWEAEYEVTFSTSCIEHDWGRARTYTARGGEGIVCQFCKMCEACQILKEGEGP